MTLHEIIKKESTTIVDVRTPSEFYNGHVPGSVNLPLDTIDKHIGILKGMSKPIVLCCRSGNRSNQAYNKLKMKGCHEIYDGGSWKEVYIHQM